MPDNEVYNFILVCDFGTAVYEGGQITHQSPMLIKKEPIIPILLNP
jgi:hypothetical protein